MKPRRMQSAFDQRREVEIDPQARNPLLDDYRQIRPEMVDYAERRDGRAPTLFPTGDLPVATASGNSPQELLKLPWQLRHAAAKASQAEWARLMNSYAGVEDAAVEMMFEPAADDPANHEYHSRMSRWLSGFGS